MQVSNHSSGSHVLSDDAARILLKRWIISCIPTGGLYSLMFIGHVFDEIYVIALFWFFMCVIPGLLMLLVVAIRHLDSDKLIHRSIINVLSLTCSIYLIAVFLVLFSVKFWMQGENNHSVESLLLQSFWLLIPWNAILCGAFWALFYRSQTFIKQLRRERLEEYVSHLVVDAQASKNEKQVNAYNFLVTNNFDELFKMLTIEFHGKPVLAELLVLQSDYNRAEKALAFQTEDPAGVNRAINRIVLALIEITQKHLQ